MPDEAELPPLDPRMVDLVREAIARGVPKIAHGEPLDTPPTLTGSPPGIRQVAEIARAIVDERLRERRVLSDSEIRVIAKEVAHTIFEQSIRPVQDNLRVFLTEEQIEGIVVDKLRDIGLRVDDAHIDETREAVTAVLRGQKRRAEMGGEFVKEVIKALAGYGAAGMIGAAGVWMMTKGGPH